MRVYLLSLSACIGCALAGFVAAIAIPPTQFFTGQVSLFGVGLLFVCCLFLAFTAIEGRKVDATIAALK